MPNAQPHWHQRLAGEPVTQGAAGLAQDPPMLLAVQPIFVSGASRQQSRQSLQAVAQHVLPARYAMPDKQSRLPAVTFTNNSAEAAHMPALNICAEEVLMVHHRCAGADESPSGSMDMSMQLSATPAAKTLAVTDALAAPAAGVCPGSLNTDAHNPAMPHTSDAEELQFTRHMCKPNQA